MMNYIFTCPNIFSFLVKAKDKIDDEIIPMDNTTKLSYRDALVKGSVNENKKTEDFMDRDYKRQQHERAVQELLNKAMEAISLLPTSHVEYDLDNENYDDLPDMPQEDLTEAQQDQLMWESFCEAYKGTEAGEYFSKAFEMHQNGF